VRRAGFRGRSCLSSAVSAGQRPAIATAARGRRCIRTRYRRPSSRSALRAGARSRQLLELAVSERKEGLAIPDIGVGHVCCFRFGRSLGG